jgi:hypothetical protein
MVYLANEAWRGISEYGREEAAGKINILRSTLDLQVKNMYAFTVRSEPFISTRKSFIHR